MQSAALNSAESSLAEASKRYKQAVHEQQTSAQAVQDATEKKEALTTQLAAHKAAHVLAKESAREQDEQTHKAGTKAQIEKEASSTASSRRAEAREEAEKLRKSLRDAERTLQTAEAHQKAAEQAGPEAEEAVRKSEMELQKARGVKDSVSKAGIPLGEADKNAKNILSEAQGKVAQQQHHVATITLKYQASERKLAKGSSDEQRLRAQVEAGEQKLSELRKKVSDLEAEVDMQIKQLQSKRTQTVQDTEDTREKEQEKASLQAELRKARAAATSLRSVRVRAEGRLGGSKSEEQGLATQIDRLNTQGDREKELAAQVIKKQLQMKSTVTPSLKGLLKAQKALKKWNAEKVDRARKAAQAAAAAVTAEATAQALEIRNETTTELLSLQKQMQAQQKSAKANYEFRMKEASKKGEREDDSVLEARAKADREQDRATRNEIKHGEDASRMKGKSQDEANEHSEELQARGQKRAAGQISSASAESMLIRHTAKKAAVVEITKGIVLDKAAQSKLSDAEAAAKEMQMLNDRKLKQANVTLMDANDEASEMEKKAQNEADDVIKPVVMKAREHERKVEKEAKDESLVIETEANKRAHAEGEEQQKHDEQTETLKVAAEESEVNTSRESKKVVADATTEAENLKMSSVKAIGELQREQAGKLEVVEDANKEAATHAEELVADAKDKVATAIADAKAKCGGEDCLSLIQKEAGAVSVLDGATDVGEGAQKEALPSSQAAVLPERDTEAEGAVAALQSASEMRDGRPQDDDALSNLPAMPKKGAFCLSILAVLTVHCQHLYCARSHIVSLLRCLRLTF